VRVFFRLFTPNPERDSYRPQHPFENPYRIIVPEPHDSKSFSLKKSSPLSIPLFRMLSAVEFDDQLRLMAEKIDHIWLSGHLPPEFGAIEAGRG
jgi:hypothetical protein